VDDWTTYVDGLVVFITVQNLVGIDAVVFIIYASFSILRLWLENGYSRPFLEVLGHISPKNVTHRINPKRTVLRRNHVDHLSHKA